MSLSKSSKVKTLGKSSAIFTKTIVQMNDVSASYDSKNYVLKDIKMSIDRGTNYAIVGHSGSGKSTLLRLINGMMNPTSGKILVDYQTPNISDKKFKSFMHKIGYIPQNLGLIKNSTVLENILIGALPRVSGFNSFLKKFSDYEIDNAKKILKQVGLEDKADRKIYMLSGGEKRRVAIARALVQKPEIVLADEIVSELDHVTAREIMDVLAEAQATMKLTSIMVHHDLQLALEYADRVAVIKEGEKVLEIGVEGGRIVDFQSGNYTQREILEMFTNESKE
jgi:phosphonate transport system ATP-binding protein